jgi:hypothetical protein
MTKDEESRRNSNPAQYERNRRVGHLVHVLGRKATGAKLPSEGLRLNASKPESRLVVATISVGSPTTVGRLEVSGEPLLEAPRWKCPGKRPSPGARARGARSAGPNAKRLVGDGGARNHSQTTWLLIGAS